MAKEEEKLRSQLIRLQIGNHWRDYTGPPVVDIFGLEDQVGFELQAAVTDVNHVIENMNAPFRFRYVEMDPTRIESVDYLAELFGLTPGVRARDILRDSELARRARYSTMYLDNHLDDWGGTQTEGIELIGFYEKAVREGLLPPVNMRLITSDMSLVPVLDARTEGGTKPRHDPRLARPACVAVSGRSKQELYILAEEGDFEARFGFDILELYAGRVWALNPPNLSKPEAGISPRDKTALPYRNFNVGVPALIPAYRA